VKFRANLKGFFPKKKKLERTKEDDLVESMRWSIGQLGS
jgi:hypothetical protein